MKPEDVVRRDRACATNKVEIKEKIYLHPKYDIDVYQRKEMTPTGLLTIGELKPKETGLPKFSLRWDDNTKIVDVDIEGVSESEKSDFRNERKGYVGHHTIGEINQDERIYDVDIKTPQINVFSGKLKVNLEFICSLNI